MKPTIGLILLLLLIPTALGQDIPGRQSRQDDLLNQIVLMQLSQVPQDKIRENLQGRRINDRQIDVLLAEAEAKNRRLHEEITPLIEAGDKTAIQELLEQEGFTSTQYSRIITALTRDMQAKKNLQPRKPGKLGDTQYLTKIIAATLFGLTIITVIIFRIYRKPVGLPTLPTHALTEYEKLTAEKQDVEQMIELAKQKYRNRKINEESFKQIMTEHEKKLLEIENKLTKLNTRIKKLEQQAEAQELEKKKKL